MNQLFTIQLDGFNNSIAISGSTLTYDGDDYDCICGTVEKKRAMQLAGWLPQTATQCDMRKSEFDSSGIADRSEVEVDGITMRVLSIETSASNPLVRLILDTAT